MVEKFRKMKISLDCIIERLKSIDSDLDLVVNNKLRRVDFMNKYSLTKGQTINYIVAYRRTLER